MADRLWREDLSSSFIKSQKSHRIEFCFLIDQSQSMTEGDSNTQVQKAMYFALRNLPQDSRFALYTFEKVTKELFAMTDTCEDSLNKAFPLIDGLKPVVNGTNILSALQKAKECPIQEGFERHVILLTDGDVSENEIDRVIDEIKIEIKVKPNIFFSFIGIEKKYFRFPLSLQKLVSAVGELGRGYHEIVDTSDKVPAAVYSVMRRSICHTFKISNLQFHGMDVLYHDKLRQSDFEVAAGDEFHMSLIIELDEDKDEEEHCITYDVTDVSDPRGMPKQMSLTVTESNESRNKFDGKLIAHLISSQLAKFDDETDNPDSNPINFDAFCRRKETHKKSIREDIEFLGTFFMILTKYTAIYFEPSIAPNSELQTTAIEEVKNANMVSAADSQTLKNEAHPAINKQVDFTQDLTIKILEELQKYFDDHSKLLKWDDNIVEIFKQGAHSIQILHPYLLSEKTMKKLEGNQLSNDKKAALATIAFQKVLLATNNTTDPRIIQLIQYINDVEEQLWDILSKPTALPPPPVAAAPIPEPVPMPIENQLMVTTLSAFSLSYQKPVKEPEPPKPVPKKLPPPRFEPTHALIPPIPKLAPVSTRPSENSSPSKKQLPSALNMKTPNKHLPIKLSTLCSLRIQRTRLSIHHRLLK